MAAGLQVEVFFHQFQNGIIRNFIGVKSLHRYGERCGFPNHIRNLNFQAVGDARRHQIFGNISAHISGAAVDFGGVFTGESAAAMPGDTAVSINQQFTPGETGIGSRAANDKSAGAVDIELSIFIQII